MGRSALSRFLLMFRKALSVRCLRSQERVIEVDVIEDPPHLFTGVWRQYAKGRKARDQSIGAQGIAPFLNSQNQDRIARLQVGRIHSIKAVSLAGSSIASHVS